MLKNNLELPEDMKNENIKEFTKIRENDYDYEKVDRTLIRSYEKYAE